jgi:hypothetical protein
LKINKTTKVIIPAGEIVGSIVVNSMPKFKQFGAPPVLASGVQYICMEIVQAHHLAASPNPNPNPNCAGASPRREP